VPNLNTCHPSHGPALPVVSPTVTTGLTGQYTSIGYEGVGVAKVLDTLDTRNLEAQKQELTPAIAGYG